MIYVGGEVGREPWLHSFTAQASEVAQLRKMVKLRLILWGLPDHVDTAQVCVSELVANVIQHIGEGTPTTLRMAMSEPYLRFEVEDPDPRALPTLLAAGATLESGRGMALVDAVTEQRWGAVVRSESKVVWCELAVGATDASGQVHGPRVSRAEAILDLYGSWKLPHARAMVGGGSVLSVAAAEEAAIGVMADVLHWLCAHGYDPEDVLDRAQTHFEAEMGEVV